MTTPPSIRVVIATAAWLAACGGGDGPSGLRPIDRTQYDRLLTCMPACLARVFAQQGCMPSGACQHSEGGVCYANGYRSSTTTDPATKVVTVTARGSGGEVCHVVDLKSEADAVVGTLHTRTGDQVATITFGVGGTPLWSVACDGQTHQVDTTTTACREATRISGTAGCTPGTCQ